MSFLLNKNNHIYFLLIITSIIGLNIYQDFGIGIEEHFQRKSGFYWLNYIINLTELNNLKSLIAVKIENIENFTPRLFPIKDFPFYGILFDLPTAFIETIFNINEPQNYFYLRHLINFFIFLLSAYFFYKLIKIQFNNHYLAIFGFIIFIFTPRIFGNIFFDNKDLFFLSIFTINMYSFVKYNNDRSITNLLIFSLFCALSTSSRIIGILVPISFIGFILIELISNNNFKGLLKILIYFLLSYFLFLFIHWPYLWSLNLSNFFNFFKPFFYAMNPTIFFSGEFYESKYLPISYLPVWIFISTPIYIVIFSLLGFIFHIRRIFTRYTLIKMNTKFNSHDLWKSKKEKNDFYFFLIFIAIIFLYFTIFPALMSGWRHFYFLNFFIIYYTVVFTHILFLKFRKKNKIKNILLAFLFIVNLILFYDISKYHPFQSSYFNNFISKETKYKFEIDTQSLSRVHALREILKENNKVAIVGTASWTPLEDARSLIPMKLWSSIQFVGTNYKNADYIYTNYIYEINTIYNKKYEIPENFYLYKKFEIDDTRIYSIFKKKVE